MVIASSTLDKALEIGAVDAVELDPAVAVAGSDLVILCTPVGMFEPLLKQIGPSLSAGNAGDGCGKHQAVGGPIGGIDSSQER